MKWIVKIENKPNLRIQVNFVPLSKKIEFVGQYKFKSEWIDFYRTCDSMDIDLEQITIQLEKTYEGLKECVERYEDLSESFKYITVIGIKGETDIVEEEKPDNEIFGEETLNESIFPPTTRQY